MVKAPAASGFSPSLAAALKAVVGPKGWSDDDQELAPHLTDWRRLYSGRAALLLRPANTDEVSRLVALCAQAGAAIVPQSGNTGLVGGQIPSPAGDQILLSLSRLNRVLAVDALDNTITVEAGCVLANVQQAAEAVDRLFPLSLAAEGSCQIGGNLSTNAGGIAVLRYGNARDLVLGLEVVLPDGRVWNGLRRLRKDNTGYDLKQLFIGAEGSLGIITAAVLKLYAKPRRRTTAIVGLDDVEGALRLLAALRSAVGETVVSFELMPRIAIDLALRHVAGIVDPLAKPYRQYVLVEIATAGAHDPRTEIETALGEALSDGLIGDAVIAANESQAAAMWRLREGIVEAQRLEGGSIKNDISVPVSRVPAFIVEAARRVAAAAPGARLVAFGHLGDGNIHYNFSRPIGAEAAAFLAREPEITRIVQDVVAEFEGSISAEHGLGQLRRGDIRRYKPAIEIELMQRLKTMLDPRGIMNPGKVI
jgi:FAD/FMN-containing dehydrogenase